MNIEIERKFLVKDTTWKEGAGGVTYRQGYLSSHPERTVRVRTAGGKGFLTIKGKSQGASRSEFEYGIPHDEATRLLDQLCEKPLIEKIRYKILYAGMLWEIDEFGGDNAGLVVAEVELTHEDQSIGLPPWVGTEVTEDPRYYNANLIRNPFSRWEK
jgi:adenylate cyclase